MLRAFGHPVATCATGWKLKIELVRLPWSNIAAQAWQNDYSILQRPQMLKSLTVFTFQPIAPNMSQHDGQMPATCCSQPCCDKLRRTFDWGLNKKKRQ